MSKKSVLNIRIYQKRNKKNETQNIIKFCKSVGYLHFEYLMY